MKREVKATIKRGGESMTRERATRIVESRIGGVLTASDIIVKDDGTVISVNDILLDPETWDGVCDLLDPVEPDYGPSKAIFYANLDDAGTPQIYSQAHGGRKYRVAYDYPTLVAAVERERERGRLDETWITLRANAVLSDGERSRIGALIKKHTKISNENQEKDLEDRERRRRGEPEEEDRDPLTHHQMASVVLAGIKARTGTAPVGVGGQLYECVAGLWVAKDIDVYEPGIAVQFQQEQHCKVKGSYTAITKTMYTIVKNEGFFDDAPAGCALPDGTFMQFNEKKGKFDIVSLTPDHRQRFQLPVAPRDPCGPA